MSERPIIIKKFNSASGFLDWATNAPCKWESELHSQKNWNNDWAGTDTYEEAYKLALYGWEDGLKTLNHQVRKAERIITTQHSLQHSYDVAGHRPHLPRAVAGDPLNMVCFPQDQIKPKPIVNIRNNTSYNSNVDRDIIMKWGASICSYINALEKNGYSTELYEVNEVSPSYNRDDPKAPNISFQFPLKNAGYNLSLINVVFWWAHPAALRRIIFSAEERLDIEKWYEDGYGRAANVTTPKKAHYIYQLMMRVIILKITLISSGKSI